MFFKAVLSLNDLPDLSLFANMNPLKIEVGYFTQGIVPHPELISYPLPKVSTLLVLIFHILLLYKYLQHIANLLSIGNHHKEFA